MRRKQAKICEDPGNMVPLETKGWGRRKSCIRYGLKKCLTNLNIFQRAM